VSLKELEALKRLKEESLKYFTLLKNTEAEEVYNKKGVDAALAVLQSSTLNKKDASSAVKNILLAKLYTEKGDPEKAGHYYVNAVETDERYEYLLEYATFLRERNATEKMESVYEKMRAQDLPKEEKAKVLKELAALYTQGKKYKKAESIYKEALILYEALAKKNPEKYDLNLAKVYKGLALYYTESGENTKAQEMYAKALALWEALEKAHAGEYTLEVSNSLYMLGKFYSSSDVEKAQSYFEYFKIKAKFGL
jgi:Tfp pilus assembly protein PilF